MSSLKPGKRRLGREAAIQFLYSNELNAETTPEQIEAFWELRPLRKDAQDFAKNLIIGVLKHRERIDARLSEALQNYKIERLAAVDRNIELARIAIERNIGLLAMKPLGSGSIVLLDPNRPRKDACAARPSALR